MIKEEYAVWAEEVLKKIRAKMCLVRERNQNKIPYTTGEDGSYDDKSDPDHRYAVDDGINWWTNGFWSGMMWLLYMDTKDDRYLETARSAEYKLEACFWEFYGLHHDVGFMYMPSAAVDYRITKNERSRKTALLAAQLLAGRYNPAGKYIRAWNDLPGGEDTRGWAIIDCMFNLSLLYWAYEESKDPRFYHIAVNHADTVRETFIREDGSVNHILEFDPWSGEIVTSHAGQGYDGDSSWVRGQAWALYGFLISYRHTGKKEYLSTADKVAKYCLKHIPENGILPVDFVQPEEPAWEDSCGACIMAGGLIELAACTEGEDKEEYLRTGVRLLQAIDEKRADYSQNCDAIVQNCSASYHNPVHHVTMNYADYYYMEALYKLKSSAFFMW